MNEIETTKIWDKYEKCKSYLDRKRIVQKTNENWNFYVGDQWNGVEAGGERLPVLNFIEPVLRYKVSVVSQNAMTAKYSDLQNRESSSEICDLLNRKFEEDWEKSKMNSIMWDNIEAAAVQGDSYLFWGECDPSVPPQVLTNTCVLLGDENITDIQNQPYILIVERRDVQNVKDIAKANGIKKDEIERIAEDSNKELQLVNKEEVSDKVTSILFMTKVNGVVNIARSTKGVVYETQHEVKGTDVEENPAGEGLRSYPIASFIWKKRPNSARGVSEVEQLIPNQIEVNKTLARMSMTVKHTAYPRLAYDGNAVQNPEDLDKVGAAIEVNGGSQSVNQMVSYLNATNMSSDANRLLTDMLTMTRELAGAGDYATGNVNPEQASGQAILAVRDQAQIPLNKQIGQYQQFVEDVALLFFDLWIAFNPDGLLCAGNTVPVQEVINIVPSVKVDVSQDNAWSKMAEQQWVDNMFEKGQVSFEEYVELCNSNAVPKGKLQAILNRRQQMPQQMPQQIPQVPME